MLLFCVGLHPPVSSLQERGPVWCAPAGQWLLPAASHKTGQFVRNTGPKLSLLLTTCTERSWLTNPTGQRLISLPKSRVGTFPGSHKEKKLASSAWGSLWWIIVLLQQRDLGLLRKVFRKQMKKNKAWIFRHLENVTKSLKKNNAF